MRNIKGMDSLKYSSVFTSLEQNDRNIVDNVFFLTRNDWKLLINLVITICTYRLAILFDAKGEVL